MPGQSSSFIPQKKQQSSSSSASSSTSTIASEAGVFLISAAVIFLLVIAGWIGIELYKRYIDQQIAQKQDQFEAAKKTLEHEGLDQIIRMDTRINAANDVIEDHIAPSFIFEKLEELTVEGLRYTSFEMEGTPKTSMKVTLTGEAHNYSTVISQARHFRRSTFLANSTFHQIQESEETGNVTFVLNLEVPADALRFDKVAEPAAGATQTGGVTQSSTSSPAQGAQATSSDGTAGADDGVQESGASNSLIPGV